MEIGKIAVKVSVEIGQRLAALDTLPICNSRIDPICCGSGRLVSVSTHL
jgi:hypothetical protein